MIQANSSDTFIVNKGSVFSSEDDSYLLDLYAPIISLKNVSIYISLRNEIGNDSKDLSSFFQKNQVTEGEFYNALEALEAIWLVKTYCLKKTENSSISFFLYCPRSPSEFFSNELLNGTLLKYTSKEYVEEMVTKYASPSKPEGYKDVSTKFMDYFQLDAEKGVYHSIEFSTLGKNSLETEPPFDKKKFIDEMRERTPYDIDENTFSKQEYIKLARLSALYAYDEETMASFLCDYSETIFSRRKPFGERINFQNLTKMCVDSDVLPYTHKKVSETSNVHGNSDLAYQIRKMDSMSSIDYLKRLQNGGKLASSDRKLINYLVMEMELPQNVTNALIFHIIKLNDGVLSAPFAEKLAGSLKRKGCKTALDTLNYLQNNKQLMALKSAKSKDVIQNEEMNDAKIKDAKAKFEQSKNGDVEITDEEADEAYEAFLNSFKKGK